MSEFSKKHPKLHAKVMSYVESGMSPEEIIAQFKKDDEDALPENRNNVAEEFPDEIMLISQALAYREAEMEDIEWLYGLFNKSYAAELIGTEAFRSGQPVSRDLIGSLLSDPSYKWLLVEAPSGRNIERDGVILGACCYSTDGVSRCNEGSLGSIRLFGVLPRYHGFCVGRRLLAKAEERMFKDYNCCRVMVCIPSPRVSMLKWVERRNYVRLGASPYPFNALNHTPTLSTKVELVQFIKTRASLLNSKDDADEKFGKVLALVKPPVKNEHSVPSTTVVSESAVTYAGDNVTIAANGSDGGASTGGRAVPPAGNPRLPPLWRHLSVSSALSSDNSTTTAADVNAEEELYSSDAKVKSSANAGAVDREDTEDDLDMGVD